MQSRNVFKVIALFGVPLLSGCAGGGNGTTNTKAPTTIVPVSTGFAGDYTGTLIDTGNNQQGTATISITPAGVITGRAFDETTEQNATVTGSISSSGSAVFNVAYPGTLTSEKGTLVLTGGHLKGTLTEYNGTTKIGTVAADFVPTSTID